MNLMNLSMMKHLPPAIQQEVHAAYLEAEQLHALGDKTARPWALRALRRLHEKHTEMGYALARLIFALEETWGESDA